MEDADFGNADLVDWEVLLKMDLVDPDLPERIRNTAAVDDWELGADFAFSAAKLIGRHRQIQHWSQIFHRLKDMPPRAGDLAKVRDSAVSLKHALLGEGRMNARSCVGLPVFLDHLKVQADQGWNDFTRMLHMATELEGKLAGRPADPLPAYNDATFEAHRLCQELEWMANAADLAMQAWEDEEPEKGGRAERSGLQNLAIDLFTLMQRGVKPGEGLGKPQEACDALREVLAAAGIECNHSDASLRTYLKKARRNLKFFAD